MRFLLQNPGILLVLAIIVAGLVVALCTTPRPRHFGKPADWDEELDAD